jgi:ferritin-like metal-binding protein YciE
MAINNLQEKFVHELKDIYDAEHQFLKGQEEMLQKATDPNLQNMITQHIDQSRQQVRNLDQVFNLLGLQPDRTMCDGAKGIVTEGQKLFKQTNDAKELLDCAIAGAASKVEHYEIAAYRGLIQAADLMGQREIVSLLQQNLQQEEQTAQRIEQSTPLLLQKAAQFEGAPGMVGRNFEQAGPTY